MMAAVAFLALALAVIVQFVQLQQARIREERLRAEAEYNLALTILTEQRQAPPAATKP
jgi:hypothetical protein